MATPTPSTRLRLDATQVETYNREGYLVYPEKVFSDAKFNKLKDHFDAKLDTLAVGQRPEAMDVPHFTDPALFEWLFADEVLDLVEPLIGPDIVLWSSHFICKPKGDGRRVPWHEDSAYWKGQLDPMKVVTVWLAIDPSTLQNGCMYVIPRTQGNGFSDYADVDYTKNVFPTEILPSQRKDELARPLELQPNYASLHDGKLQHGSPANTSNIRRCGYTMRYMPASVKFNDGTQNHIGAMHQIYLARGRGNPINHYADPAKAYPELARFRTESGKKFH